VDPVTATLPVAPDSVHSGVPPLAGGAVGHALASVAVSAMEGGVNTSETEDELAAGGSASEPHAASVITNDAAQATSATEEGTREEFTVVTLQPHYAVFAGGPALRCQRWIHRIRQQGQGEFPVSIELASSMFGDIRVSAFLDDVPPMTPDAFAGDRVRGHHSSTGTLSARLPLGEEERSAPEKFVAVVG
jgi:hypothetical protein